MVFWRLFWWSSGRQVGVWKLFLRSFRMKFEIFGSSVVSAVMWGFGFVFGVGLNEAFKTAFVLSEVWILIM